MKGYTNLQILDHRQGRFGNQLFRLSTMIGQSIINNVDYFIPSEWEHCNLFPNLKNKFNSNILRTSSTSHFKEPNFGYTILPKTTGLLQIEGYFQSWKYFENLNTQVMNDLKFEESILNTYNKNIDSSTENICIHIRWGDIYDRKVGGGHKGVEDKHPVMSLRYYENAIEYILSQKNIKKLYVFTDNDDTKNFIFGKFEKYLIDIVYIDYKENFIEDFILQSSCNNFIIANSTFSWWSSFLSPYNEKIICCPNESDWFGPSYVHLDRSTLLPRNWIRINQI